MMLKLLNPFVLSVKFSSLKVWKSNLFYFNRNNVVLIPFCGNTTSFSNNHFITSNPKCDRNSITEKEYLVKIKDDPDSFGHLIESDDLIYPSDIKEEEFISNPPTRSKQLLTKQYADIIKRLIQKRKVKEAIDFLEMRMLKEDKVKPENYIFNLIIGVCGRVGYTKKAFSLYNQMKKRGLKPTSGTYTALFNACANSPWLVDGLGRAEHLRNFMIETRYEPNDSNYNAMIKAFGRCGNLNVAFQLVDEMINKKILVKDDTLNFLLQACITDTEAGFRHALLVWRKFHDKSIKPSIFSYNLLLRCIRDCSLGDVNVTRDVITKLLPPSDQNMLSHNSQNQRKAEVTKTSEINIFFSESDVILSKTESAINETNTFDEKHTRPNLLSKVPHLGNIISLNEITKPEDRLLLVGGLRGFIENMQENECKPDIKTCSLLLDCVANNLQSELELLKLMKLNHVKADLDFYNMLMKKRCFRTDYQGARDVLRMIEKVHKQPNLLTYGVLALTCTTSNEARLLITEMRVANYRINIEILGAMLKQACCHMNFPYVMEVMDICLTEEVPVNDQFMDHLELFRKRCKYSKSTDAEYVDDKDFQMNFQKFRKKLKEFKEKVVPEPNIHPWEQYRNTTETDVQHYKDKAIRFKAKHTSLFRQKTAPIELVSTKKWKYRKREKRNYKGTNKDNVSDVTDIPKLIAD